MFLSFLETLRVPLLRFFAAFLAIFSQLPADRSSCALAYCITSTLEGGAWTRRPGVSTKMATWFL